MKRVLNQFLFVLILWLVLMTGCKEKTTEPYIETVSAPTFSPDGGTFSKPQYVSINSATIGVTIVYTTDGTVPVSSSQVYTDPVFVDRSMTLKAIAYRQGMKDSLPSTASYTISTPPLPQTFILIEGGYFYNGTSVIGIDSFYMDKYEVTQGSYSEVMGVNPSQFLGNLGRPVEKVTWFNAIEYCNKRSILEGLSPCYTYSTNGVNPDDWPENWDSLSANHTSVDFNMSSNGYRLPTEMEWEYSARGGVHSNSSFLYSGSSVIDSVAWYLSNSTGISHEVGMLAPNEIGIYDLSGNVWEWCWDVYGAYPSGNQLNPMGAVIGNNRVFRGGGWSGNASSCQITVRSNTPATLKGNSLGFRVCRKQ